MNYRQITITTLVLLLFALAGTAMVAFTWEQTHERIAANERATLLRKLNQLIPAERYDNALLDDRITVVDPALLGTSRPVSVYRARHRDEPVALVMDPVAPDGYSGSIHLLVGINRDGSLAGVRVIAHRETPGLGDAIDEDRSDWILGFDGRSLQDPPPGRWAVKKDGGDFDQLTGATISPRAVVNAVRRCLRYYQAHRGHLFSATASVEQP